MAGSASPNSSILIRRCEGLEEFAACVCLQTAVWGLEERDVIPCRSFVVACQTGGQAVGAFDTSLSGAGFPGAGSRGDAKSLIGFAMALAGIAPPLAGEASGRPYLHSHMLAVDPRYRNQGIGRRLKLFQREEALARGLARMEWTFDPLEIKNAFFNVMKLGAVVRRYTANLYGISSSRLQGGLPTDRLHAEWWMKSGRVHAAIHGYPLSSPSVERRILVPGKVYHWKQTPGEQKFALEVQQTNRTQFEQAFAGGLAVFGFAIDAEGNGVFELGRWEELPGIENASRDASDGASHARDALV